MNGPISAAQVEAEKQPSSVSVNLNPQESDLAVGLTPGAEITFMVKGTIRSVNLNDYGNSFSVDADLIGIKPQPEPNPPGDFMEEMDEIRVSAAK